jgi:hypothetical protein
MFASMGVPRCPSDWAFLRKHLEADVVPIPSANNAEGLAHPGLSAAGKSYSVLNHDIQSPALDRRVRFDSKNLIDGWNDIDVVREIERP